MARGWQHRLELRLANPSLGARRRWRLRLPAVERPAAKADAAQFVRSLRTVSNRRQFRRAGGHGGDAFAKPSCGRARSKIRNPNARAAAGFAEGVADWQRD